MYITGLGGNYSDDLAKNSCLCLTLPMNLYKFWEAHFSSAILPPCRQVSACGSLMLTVYSKIIITLILLSSLFQYAIKLSFHLHAELLKIAHLVMIYCM